MKKVPNSAENQEGNSQPIASCITAAASTSATAIRMLNNCGFRSFSCELESLLTFENSSTTKKSGSIDQLIRNSNDSNEKQTSLSTNDLSFLHSHWLSFAALATNESIPCNGVQP
jgi:hypothetical protein